MEDKKKEIILGLDVSTACIGCCVYLNDEEAEYGKIIELTHIVPKVHKNIKGIESLCLKTRIFNDEFLMKWKDFGITKVVIEEPLLNSNNINTVGTLLKFNGMVSSCVFNTLNIVPEFISSYDARKYSFPELMTIRKYNKKGETYDVNKLLKAVKKSELVLFGSLPWDVDKKEVMWNMVSNVYKDIEWLYNKGKLLKENFDANDALVASIAYANKNKYGELNVDIDNIIKNDDKITFDVNYWGKKFKHKIILDKAE